MKNEFVQVKITGTKNVSKVRIAAKTPVSRLLEKLAINRESVAVKVNGRLVPEEGHLFAGDKVEILYIVTGG